MLPNENELKQLKAHFETESVSMIRNQIFNNFIEEPERHRRVIASFNRAMASLPIGLLNLKETNLVNLFYNKYDEYCKDILALFDEFIASEAKMNEIYDAEPPIEALVHLMSGNIEAFQKIIASHAQAQVSRVIIGPFFDNLDHRLVKHKLGNENYERIKERLG